MGDRDLKQIARKRFGYQELLPGQEEAIRSAASRRDTLAIMPTGGGKSAIYQIAGLLLKGPTVVVCPLIALQKDQIDAIAEQDVAPAAVLNSAITEGERQDTLDDLEDGDLEFLFLAPEQFRNRETLDRVKEAKPSLFVVDEAHCISEWGHDFRPEYLNLGAVIEELGHPVVLALTATAAPPVREEIVTRLRMREARVIVRGFNRPNIHLAVRHFKSEKEKIEALLSAVQDAEKPGIVYASTRKAAETLATALSDLGVKAVHYHGGMKASDRTVIQDGFMEGREDVIVATSAFGMGVDKPDVRFVFHYDISDSVDAYYQEIGRAGRDGQAARAVLFYRPEDLSIHRFLKGGGRIDAGQLEKVAELVHAADGPVSTDVIRQKTGLSKTKVCQAISRLEEAGALKKLPGGEAAAVRNGNALRSVALEAAREQERRREHIQLRIEKVRAYAEVVDCLRNYLLNYFGEDTDAGCGNCDNCERAARGEVQPGEISPDQPFPLRCRVVHSELGRGTVEGYEAEKIVVLFDEEGRRTLALATVIERGLLQRAS